MMDIREYKDAVRAFIESGRMTDEHWEEIATALLNVSEGDTECMTLLDTEIYGPPVECPACGQELWATEDCWRCCEEATDELFESKYAGG